ncbi:hypothetical protein Mapa_011967 [Marchantia paleacea]|nr:hypothetical protein Mapa_011967 [Marchantia paleacea]
MGWVETYETRRASSSPAAAPAAPGSFSGFSISSVVCLLLAFTAGGYATLPPLKKYRGYMSATTTYLILPSLIALFFLAHRSRSLRQTIGRMLG